MSIAYGIRIGYLIAMVLVLIFRFLLETLFVGGGFIAFIGLIVKSEKRKRLHLFLLITFIIVVKFIINSVQFIIIPLVLVKQFSWQFLLMALVFDIILSNYLLIRDYLRKEDIENRNIIYTQKLVIKPKFLKDEQKEDAFNTSISAFGYAILTIFYLFVVDLNSIFNLLLFIIFISINLPNIFKTFISLVYVFRKDITSDTRKRIIEETIIGILRLTLITYFVFWTFEIDLFSTFYQIGKIEILWIYLILLIVVVLFLLVILIYSLGERRNIKYHVEYIEKNLKNHEEIKEIMILNERENREKLLIQKLNKLQNSFTEIKKQLLEKSKKILLDLIKQDINYSFKIDEKIETDESKLALPLIYEITNIEKEAKLDNSLNNNKQLNDYYRTKLEELLSTSKYKIFQDRLKDELSKNKINIRRIKFRLIRSNIGEYLNLDKISSKKKLEMIDIKLSNIDDYDIFLELIDELLGNREILKKINSLCKPVYDLYLSLKTLLSELDQLSLLQQKQDYYIKLKHWLEDRIIELKFDTLITKQRRSIDITNKIIQGFVWIISNGLLLIIKQYLNF